MYEDMTMDVIMEEMMETLNIPKKAAEEGIDDE